MLIGSIVLVFFGVIFAIAGITSITPDKTQMEIIANTAFSEILALVLFGLAIFLYIKHREEQKIQAENLQHAIDTINNGGIAPIETTNIILKSGEQAYYQAHTYISETKTKAAGSTGSGGGVSFRVAKGVYVRSGSGSSRKVYKTVTERYPGIFIITNKRLVFISQQKPFDIPYSKLTGLFKDSNNIGIQTGSKSYLIAVNSPEMIAAIINQVKE